MDGSRFDRAPEGAAATAWGTLADRAPADREAADRFADDLLDQLTLDERIGLLSGDDPLVAGLAEMANHYNRRPIPAGAVPRLGLPGIRFSDGPRGVVMYRSTAFPTSMARGATFDPELEERVGDAIGVEVRAQGGNLFAGVCINLLRHPAWGRAQETYGEDSWLLGELGAALTRGVQRHVMACVKHYAANSMENSRFWVDVRVDEADLRDLYLPHFRRVVDEGVAGVMSAYNRVNGTFCGHHHHLLRDVLKGEWGFDGFVMSDFTFGVRGPRAVESGQDLEMPQQMWFRRLPALVRSGRIGRRSIDEAARRLVRTQVRFASVGEPDRYVAEAVASPEHRALAREAATRALVLLRNDAAAGGAPVLPLAGGAPVRRLAVVGGLAAMANLGDRGSSRVHPPDVVTLLDGLRAAGERHDVEVLHDDGDDLERAAALARSCDAAVTVLGTTWRDEGEWVVRDGGDRASLRLPDGHEVLAAEVGRAQPRHVVVLMGGSAFETDALGPVAPALVMAWYPGMEGGHAVADVLFGDAEPEGRLPLTWPRRSTKLPPFRRFARRITYGPLHGYRMMEATAQAPAFPFGHGLTYTELAWGEPELVEAAPAAAPSLRRRVVVAVDVTNRGDRPGTEVVQAYVPEVLGTHPRALRTLRGAAVARAIRPGETRRVTVDVDVPSGATVVHLGRSSAAADHVSLRLPG